MKKTPLFICLVVLVATAAPGFAARDYHRHRSVIRHVNRGHHWNGSGHWVGARHRHSNWAWHRRHHRRVIVINSFGYPFFGYPYLYGYPYCYGYYGAPNGFQFSATITPDYRNGYAGNAGGYARSGNTSVVARVQQKLSREGYYHGGIDGVMGSRTHYAVRAYKRAHHLRVDGEIDEQLLNALNLR